MGEEKGKKEGREELKLVSVKIPAGMLNQIQELIDMGRYVNKSEFIRSAIRNELARAKKEVKRGRK